VAGGIQGLDSYEEADSDVTLDDEDGEGGARFISLPEWDSSSGFRLMERFAAGFRNPLIRSELTTALNRGRGVFRAFKDVLSRYPEAEKLWFAFKDKEMKREVIQWYNGLREEWGLEKIGIEPEETGDLVLEDFRFRPFREEDLPKAKALHDLCQEESRQILAEGGMKNAAKILIKESQAFQYLADNLFDETRSLPPAAMSAESGGGEFAGFISGIVKESVLYIQYLEVKAEYRGLGIGETLLLRFLESFDPNDISQAVLDLPSWAEDFSRVLLRESFKPYTVRYSLDLRDKREQ
ncbi:MAG: GNAT family N-acetyltransferase, partial [Treponema sp.]|nr:GNAT family N-acetyltransferase [Treponema sp.]